MNITMVADKNLREKEINKTKIVLPFNEWCILFKYSTDNECSPGQHVSWSKYWMIVGHLYIFIFFTKLNIIYLIPNVVWHNHKDDLFHNFHQSYNINHHFVHQSL